MPTIEHNKPALVSLAERCCRKWPMLSDYLDEISTLETTRFKSVPPQPKEMLEGVYWQRVLLARKLGKADPKREQSYESLRSYDGDVVRGHVISLRSEPKYLAFVTDASMETLIDVSLNENLIEDSQFLP